MTVSDQRGVFISWSQPVSGAIAKCLKPFLEDVLAPAAVFASQAMEGGTRWGLEIPQWLEACNAGLVLVTRENAHAPWLHFEAGALSKQFEGSRVVPLLCGASIGDIQGTPLSLFQAKPFDHDNLVSVCVAFGLTFTISEEVVRRRFERNWPELEKAVSSAYETQESQSRELGFADLMGVLERLASQLTNIEHAVQPPVVGALAGLKYSSGMFGGPTGHLPRFSDVVVDSTGARATDKALLEELARLGFRRKGEETIVVPVGQPCPISGYWRGSGEVEQHPIWIAEDTPMPPDPAGGKVWILVERSESDYRSAGPDAS